LGGDLASQLGVTVGDHAAITLPRFDRGSLTVDNFDVLIAGVASKDVPAFESRRVIMPVEDLRAILANGDVFSKVNVRLARPDQQKQVLATLKSRLGPGIRLTSWQDMNASFFAALMQERVAMTVIISLVTLVALSNIMSSMVLLVRHKAREIAILRTCGMSRYSIAKVFIGVGATIGLAGEAAGLGIGFGLKAAKDAIARALLAATPHPSVDLNALLSLPLSISAGETAWIVALVSIGILGSTLYPAIRAAAVDPASVLRYT
jgi:lipoprotein-releasing system permease protein